MIVQKYIRNQFNQFNTVSEKQSDVVNASAYKLYKIFKILLDCVFGQLTIHGPPDMQWIFIF